jgi:spermidine/putrescine transport system permease protein
VQAEVRSQALAWSLVTPALCCVIGFVLAPIVCLGIYSFWSHLGPATVGYAFTMENWRELATDPFYARILGKTLLLASASTLICAVVGYGPAYYLTTLPPTRRAFLVTLLFLPGWIS